MTCPTCTDVEILPSLPAGVLRQILDGDGVFLREVGVVSSETLQDGRRYTKSEFNEPTGVAASLDGSRVYVADAGNHRIKVGHPRSSKVTQSQVGFTRIDLDHLRPS